MVLSFESCLSKKLERAGGLARYASISLPSKYVFCNNELRTSDVLLQFWRRNDTIDHCTTTATLLVTNVKFLIWKIVCFPSSAFFLLYSRRE